jgi:hypothetical protein
MKVTALLSIGLALTLDAAANSSRVRFIRVPEGGIQPQAVLDEGVVHLVYYQGEAAKGNLLYVRREPRQTNFSRPLQVNTRQQSAIAAGTIRGAQMTVGRNGRVHVAWNGPTPEGGNYMDAPMLYTRLNDDRTRFEPERDVITAARGLDGGGSVAADKSGNVYVMWHAPRPGSTNGEPGRALFVVRSKDDGKSFSREMPATSLPTGACACCGMKAFADNHGNVFALFRGAADKLNRDEVLLISRDRGVNFDIVHSHPWKIAACPMSSAAFGETKDAVLAAWETESNIYFSRIDRRTLRASKPQSPPGAARRKHPIVLGNAASEFLIAWAEGTGWARGGVAAWQAYDASGKPTAEQGRVDGLPAWSLLSGFSMPDGTFFIIY